MLRVPAHCTIEHDALEVMAHVGKLLSIRRVVDALDGLLDETAAPQRMPEIDTSFLDDLL